MESSLFETKTQQQPTLTQPTPESQSTQNMLFWGGLLVAALIIMFIIFTQWKKNCNNSDDGFIEKVVKSDTAADFDVKSTVARIQQKQEDYLSNKQNTTSGDNY